MSETFNDSSFTLDFQRLVLKILASNLSFAANYGELLKEEYFENQPLRLMFSIIKTYVYQYEKEITLSEASVLVAQESQRMGFTTEQSKDLDGEARAIFNKSVQSEQFVTDQLTKFIRRQELKAALFQSVDIMEKDGSYESVLQIIDTAVSVGSGTDDGIKFGDLFDIPKTYRLKYNTDKLITTGFHHLDKCLEGGMAPGELHVLQAPPKTGKTSWGVNIGAANLRQGKAVFHITCEVKRDDLAMKYAMNIAGLTKEEICDTDTARYETAMKRFSKVKPNLFINYWTELTANSLNFRSWISRIRAKTGVSPDLVIVDYDDLILPVAGYNSEDMYGNAGAVYSDLIQLGDYFKCFVGSTRIATACRNWTRRIDEVKAGEKLKVLANREGNGIHVVDAEGLGQLGTTRVLTRIGLESDQVIECTPDHKIMLRNKNFIEAKDLRAGMELFPLGRVLMTETINLDHDEPVYCIRVPETGNFLLGAGVIVANCPIVTFAQPQRDAWEWPKDGKLITFDKLAHSAKKAHKCYSLCSLNFADDSNEGWLYVDIVRRGESKVKIKVIKDMERSRFIEEGRAR
jgi:hypothetical protein